MSRLPDLTPRDPSDLDRARRTHHTCGRVLSVVTWIHRPTDRIGRPSAMGHRWVRALVCEACRVYDRDATRLHFPETTQMADAAHTAVAVLGPADRPPVPHPAGRHTTIVPTPAGWRAP